MYREKNSTLPDKAEILKQIEENRLFIEQLVRERPKHWRVIRESEEADRRLLEIIRQLART